MRYDKSLDLSNGIYDLLATSNYFFLFTKYKIPPATATVAILAPKKANAFFFSQIHSPSQSQISSQLHSQNLY